jgi:outer membrane immunogenic protein
MRRLFLAIIGAGLLVMSSSSAFAICRLTGSNSASASSVVGGAQLGYGWQRGSFVYGLETDISAMDLRSEMNTVLTPSVFCFATTATANTNADVNWYGTFRGRIGWSSGPVLFYGTGGLAYGRVELNSSLNASAFTLSASSLNGQTSSVKTGWVAGGGIEYLLSPNVFLNLGYQYVDLGTTNLSNSSGGPFPIIALTQSASAHAQFQIVTLGLSFKFASTDAAWQGGYFGGHAGGAWGDNTNGNYSGLFFSCFTATTQVLMADGTSRPIAAVKIGDEVLGANGEINRVVAIETPVLGTRKLYAFNDGPAFVTPEHPFMTRAGWKSIAPQATFAENNNFPVAALKVGDELVKLEAVRRRLKPMSVAFGAVAQAPAVEIMVETNFAPLESMTPHDGDTSMIVYNLRLDGNHTYFANNYLVHNK